MANSAVAALVQQSGALLLSQQVVRQYEETAAVEHEPDRRDRVVGTLHTLGSVISSCHLQQLIHWGAFVRWTATTQKGTFAAAASSLISQLVNDPRMQPKQLQTINTARMRVALLMQDERDDIFWLEHIVKHTKLSLNMLKALVAPNSKKAWLHLPQPQRHEFWREILATSNSSNAVSANCEGTTHRHDIVLLLFAVSTADVLHAYLLLPAAVVVKTEADIAVAVEMEADIAVAVKMEADSCSVHSALSALESPKTALDSETISSAADQTERLSADEEACRSGRDAHRAASVKKTLAQWQISIRALLSSTSVSLWKHLHQAELADEATAESLLIAMEAVTQWTCYSNSTVSTNAHTSAVAESSRRRAHCACLRLCFVFCGIALQRGCAQAAVLLV